MQLLPLRKPIYSKLIRLQCVMLNRFIKNKIATQKNTAQQRAVFFILPTDYLLLDTTPQNLAHPQKSLKFPHVY